MLSGILPKGFGKAKGRVDSSKVAVVQTVKPLTPNCSQINTDNVTGLHPKVYGDFINLSGDVGGLFGLVKPELYGDATDVVGRVDHLRGDIAYLARRLTNPSLI